MSARIRWSAPQGAPRASLLCLPYAGGDGAAFRDWPARLAGAARVGWAELPGRGDHFKLASLTRIREQVDWLLAEAQAVPPPLVVFGHSMGALIGYELAHALRDAGAPAPALLLLAAHHAPGRPTRREALHQLPDPVFVKRLARFEGMPSEVLAHAELLQLLTPRLRADFEACETYEASPRAPLSTPLVIYGGASDREVPAEALLHWAPLTSARFECVLLPGQHFFVQQAAHALLRDIAARLPR